VYHRSVDGLFLDMFYLSHAIWRLLFVSRNTSMFCCRIHSIYCDI